MFPTHTIDSAPSASTGTMEMVQKNYGFLPNLVGKLAESPTALNGYISLAGVFSGDSATLSAEEQQIVLVATSAENGCDYCAAAHGMMAYNTGLNRGDVSALQTGASISDEKLEALRTFTTVLVQKRGWASEADIKAFLNAGYTEAQVLEVIVGIAVKTISNYVNHVAKPELDAPFTSFAVVKEAAE